MEFWIQFWAIVLGLSMTGFSVLAIVVAIGGWRDLRKMLADLKQKSGA